jgi:hypothetical protein
VFRTRDLIRDSGGPNALDHSENGACTGLTYTSMQRIWKAHELKPHRVKTFKLSNGKRFVEKAQNIVGVYLDPPDKVLVLLS